MWCWMWPNWTTTGTKTMAEVKLAEDDPRHGTVNGYTNLGCRCPACTRSNADRMRDYMNRHPEQREKHRQRERAKSARGAVVAGILAQIERDLEEARAKVADLERARDLFVKLYG